eukprot:Pgem_evm1s3680
MITLPLCRVCGSSVVVASTCGWDYSCGCKFRGWDHSCGCKFRGWDHSCGCEFRSWDHSCG